MRQKALACENEMTPNHANRLPTILKNNKPLTGSCTSVDDLTDTGSIPDLDSLSSSSSPETARKPINKPQKKVSFRLSDLRRQSLTGSLPDLAKASKKDVQTSNDNLKHITRGPLPEGSTAFKAAMNELDTDSESDSSDSASGSLRHSWNDGVRTDDQKKKMYCVRGQKFQSKAAAMIYSKVYAPSLRRGKTQSGSNDRTPSNSVSKSKRECCRHLASPNTSQSPGSSSKSSPQNERRSKNSSGRSPSPAHRLSPLVSGELTEIVAYSDKVTVRPNIAESRRQQKS